MRYLAIFLVFLPVLAYAAPSVTGVSGTVTHGQSITISGSGFGTKSPAAPLLWDTVDNQSAYSGLSNGDTIPVGTGYPWGLNSAGGATQDTKYLNTESRQRGKSTASYTNSTTWSADIGGKKKTSLGGRNWSQCDSAGLYVTWYQRSAGDWANGGQSCKILRASVDGTTYADYTNSWTGDHIQLYDNVLKEYRMMIWTTYPSQSSTDWRRNEAFFDNTTATKPTVSTWIDGSVGISNIYSGGAGYCPSGVCTAATFPDPMHGIYVIGYDPNIDGDTDPAFDMDDIYVDSTLARVEICSGSTWSDRGHCEIQIPSAWSATSATVTVNQGSFADSSSAYLYVVDSTGDTGRLTAQVTFGAGSSPTGSLRPGVSASGVTFR